MHPFRVFTISIPYRRPTHSQHHKNVQTTYIARTHVNATTHKIFPHKNQTYAVARADNIREKKDIKTRKTKTITTTQKYYIHKNIRVWLKINA